MGLRTYIEPLSNKQNSKKMTQARQPAQSNILAYNKITPDSLKSYLDQKMGPDHRMTAWSYKCTADLLFYLGFKTLFQVEECIAGYNYDRVSRAIWDSRQGQLSRFEDTLLAAMGDNFIRRHPWYQDAYGVQNLKKNLERLRNAGILIRAYDPLRHKV
jgi:putative GTP pyrophosphokinase